MEKGYVGDLLTPIRHLTNQQWNCGHISLQDGVSGDVEPTATFHLAILKRLGEEIILFLFSAPDVLLSASCFSNINC